MRRPAFGRVREVVVVRLLVAVGVVALSAFAARGQVESAADRDARMAWWRDARFGLFIHWGLYSIPAGEWNGSTGHAEWIRTTAQIPLAEYDELVDEFDPVDFDADEWARLAKRAGMRYIVITSKHHDGFCLFDSAQTDFDVMSTPFHRDILAELAEATRAQGLEMCWYHSIMDWHHPDYLPRRGWETDRSAEGADFSRYVEYLRAQVTELLTNYGDIGVMWFDGEWEATWTSELGDELYALCREIQPDVIVNNRVSTGRAGMAGLTRGPGFAGDFGTPEQEVPSTGLPGVDWETCMTMNAHWGWNAADTRWKSDETLIRTLVDVVSKGGNFLLNVGPTAEGRFPPNAVERLEAIGAWMDVNGEAIHGTEASPFESLAWGRATVRRDGEAETIYLHVFDWPSDGRLVVPGLGTDPAGAALLADASAPVGVERRGADVVLSLPREAPDHACSVVRLDFPRGFAVYRAPEIVAPGSIFVDTLEVGVAETPRGVTWRYTLDGSVPSASSPAVGSGVAIDRTATVRVRGFVDGVAVTTAATRRFERVEAMAPVEVGAARDGLRCETFEGEWDAVPDFGSLAASETRVVPGVALPGREEFVARRYTGYVRVPSSGVWTFVLTSDDGSRLYVGDRLVVDNDGLHGAEAVAGEAALGAGWHPIRIEYFNKTGGSALELLMGPVGGTPAAPQALCYEP